MPAMLEDPTAPVLYRTSGAPPYPTPNDPQIPNTIVPRQVTLRDRITIATLVPFSHSSQVPPSLLAYLCAQFSLEIEKGDTYPMIAPMPLSSFGPYWFQNFGAVMLLGEIETVDEVVMMERRQTKWEKVCLGSFYLKPNYPGRSSHVCNGGFIVTDAARNRGVGRLMGEAYLDWAPKLGYTYSVFNLVYETNVASCRIWDALGFKRIGRVKACGNLRSHPDELVDAIIYGRDLGPEGEDFVSEERFDKIRFYLKHGKYPNGADRAEKSRLRSAATHYKLIPAEEDKEGEERLMLKDKEVVADPQRQYEIARQVHATQHGGINKTTAAIAEHYHWVRIKETVSLAIKNCPECKDATKIPTVRPSADGNPQSPPKADGAQHRRSNHGPTNHDPNALIERLVNFDDLEPVAQQSAQASSHSSQQNLAGAGQTYPQNPPPMTNMTSYHSFQSQLQDQIQHELHGYNTNNAPPHIPLDPQIMAHQSQQQQQSQYNAPEHQLEGFQANHGSEHEQYQLNMNELAGTAGSQAPNPHDDTRLATMRHIRHHDEPDMYVHEGHEGAKEDDIFMQ